MEDVITTTITDFVLAVRASGTVVDVNSFSEQLHAAHPTLGLTELRNRIFAELTGYGANDDPTGGRPLSHLTDFKSF